MASGWDKSSGALHRFYVSESDFWASFNYVFSEACAKRTTYKFGLIKSILDSLNIFLLLVILRQWKVLTSKATGSPWKLTLPLSLRMTEKTLAGNSWKQRKSIR